MDIHTAMHTLDQTMAYALDESHFRLVLKASKGEVSHVTCVYNYEFDFPFVQRRRPMIKEDSDASFDYFTITLGSVEPGIGYVFELESRTGEKATYAMTGLFDTFSPKDHPDENFILNFPNANDVIRENPKFSGRLFYQIFPDRFHRSEKSPREDYMTLDWHSKKVNNMDLAGGNLQGIIEKLDYLKSIGVGGLYINPVHPSDNAHKFNVFDYYDIDRTLGTREDFRQLVGEAHKRDILVMMDTVFNHVGIHHPLFEDVLEKGRESPYFDWFFIHGDKPSVEHRNYCSFAHTPFMPKLNTNKREVQDYLIDVGRYWLTEYHIDGFRLDVANDVSRAFWRRFRDTMRHLDPDCFILGENWLDCPFRLVDGEWDSVMNYPLRREMLRFFNDTSVSAEDFKNSLVTLKYRYPEPTNRMLFNLLDSHDTERAFTSLHKDKSRYYAAMALLMMLPGLPSIYYGDEILMAGKGDPDCRRPMLWDSPSYRNGDFRMMSAILNLHRHPCLQKGSCSMTGDGAIFKVERRYGKKRLSYLFNRSIKALPLPEGKILFTTSKGEEFLPETVVIVETGL